jgi:hypothetical protein
LPLCWWTCGSPFAFAVRIKLFVHKLACAVGHACSPWTKYIGLTVAVNQYYYHVPNSGLWDRVDIAFLSPSPPLDCLDLGFYFPNSEAWCSDEWFSNVCTQPVRKLFSRVSSRVCRFRYEQFWLLYFPFLILRLKCFQLV